MKALLRFAPASALCLWLSTLSLLSLHAREFRDLTNLEGKVVRAELVDLTEDNILKVRLNLKDYEIPLDKLSKEDRKWLIQWNADKKGIKLVPKLDPDAGYSRVIFSDDFASNAFGPRWGHYKSQSAVQDGVLVGTTGEGSDHAAVDSITIDPEKDLEVSVKFRFMSEQAKSFNVWFDDKKYQGSHAGHICSVSVSPTGVNISDAKTGGMDNQYYDRKKADTLTEDEKKLIASKSKNLPVKLSMQEWHELVIRTSGDKCQVALDGALTGEFQSEGIAHDTKCLVSLTTNLVDVHYDDFSIKGIGTVLANP